MNFRELEFVQVMNSLAFHSRSFSEEKRSCHFVHIYCIYVESGVGGCFSHSKHLSLKINI